MRKILSSAISMKVKEIEFDFVDGKPRCEIRDGKIVARSAKQEKEKVPAGGEVPKKPMKFPVWRVDEKLAATGEGEPEFDIQALDEANAILVCAELGIDVTGKKIADLRKSIWSAIYKG
jgi:hypothetical protein